MTSAATLWAIVFSVIVYMACVDDNVPIFISLIFKWVQSLLIKAIKWLTIYPESPWMVLAIRRNADRNAKQLAKDLGLDKKPNWFDRKP